MWTKQTVQWLAHHAKACAEGGVFIHQLRGCHISRQKRLMLLHWLTAGTYQA